jgi:hypothetical protein
LTPNDYKRLKTKINEQRRTAPNEAKRRSVAHKRTKTAGIYLFGLLPFLAQLRDGVIKALSILQGSRPE